MKKKLTHNLGLKIASVLIAISLWIVAVNINDPVSQRAYTVSVQLLNMNTLTDAGKYVEVLDDTDTVRVTVRASRSVLENFSEKNIIATADASKMTEDNQLPISVSSGKADARIESMVADKDYVELSVEDVVKVQKRITVSVVNEPAEGYMLGNISTDQNAVIISGPESVVAKVASTEVEINVDGAASDVNITLPVHLYDADGHEVEDSRLTTSVSKVFTTAAVLQKKEVPIEYKASGEPKEGYIFTGNFIRSPESVTIAAKPAVLRNVNSIVIDDALDLEDATANVEATVELKQYLPEGCILADNVESGTVSVIARVEEEVVRILEIPADNITLTNVPQGYRARLRGVEDTLTVRLAGLSARVDEVEEATLRGYIDIAEFFARLGDETIAEGSYYPSASFTLPETVYVKEPVTVHIVVEEE